MIRSFERLTLELHGARQWLARQSPGQRRARQEMSSKAGLAWWLVYGSTRSGTSYMMRVIKSCSRLYVADWSLAPLLEAVAEWAAFKSLPAHNYITFDLERLLRDVSRNVLDNADRGDGEQLDLVYKQAALRPKEYRTLVSMWGPPGRTIFCLREPAGFMASATRKWAQGSDEVLQQAYIDALEHFFEIGGDVFQYTPDLTLADYTAFLQPLRFDRKHLPEFRYRGERAEERTTEAMWEAFRSVREVIPD